MPFARAKPFPFALRRFGGFETARLRIWVTAAPLLARCDCSRPQDRHHAASLIRRPWRHQTPYRELFATKYVKPRAKGTTEPQEAKEDAGAGTRSGILRNNKVGGRNISCDKRRSQVVAAANAVAFCWPRSLTGALGLAEVFETCFRHCRIFARI